MFSRTTRQPSRFPQFVRFNAGPSLEFLERPKLLRATDAILAALIVVFPFIMGGREAWGHRILITMALALGCVWSLHKLRTGGRFVLLAIEPLIIAGLLLVWLQTVPLAPHVMEKISPEYERLLPGWTETQLHSVGSDAKTQWRTASLLPTETQHAFLMLLSYGVIGIVVAQRLTTEEDCHRMLKLVGISGILMAVFAVVQLATSNDLFFWFYRHPYTGTRFLLKGAFTNRNHFAQFLALSIGPLTWWMLSQRRDTNSGLRQLKGLGPARTNHSRFDNIVDMKMLMMVCAVGGVIVSIMLSLSRGGMMAAALASTVCLAGLWKSGRVGASLALVIVGVGGIAVAGIMVLGQGKIEDRIDQLASVNADQIDRSNSRRAIWAADSRAVTAFPLIGSGVGSHRYIYPVYMQDLVSFRGTIFSHAESSYVHLATETGLVGLALAAMGMLFSVGRILWHLLKRTETERVAALSAVIASLFAGLFHAAVDFIWYVPAIVVTTIVLGVVGLRLCTGFRPELGIPFPRLGWLMGGVGCLLILCRVQPELAQRIAGERCWTQYKNTSDDLDASLVATDETIGLDGENEEFALVPAEPAETEVVTAAASYDESQNRAVEKNEIKALSTRMNLLLKGIKADPQHLDTLHELSLLSLKMFQLRQQISDNPLNEVQIRDAALSNFNSTGEMHAWLTKAFGRNIKLLMLSDQMARRTLALCPVHGEAYMVLLHTGFLRDVRDSGRESLMNQTLLVGGNDPYIRYFVGDCLLTDGRAADAMAQWQFVFHSSPEYRTEVCRNISRHLPANFALTTFNPTIDELDEVLAAFRERGRQIDTEHLLYVIDDKIQEELEARDSGTGQSTEKPTDTSHYVGLLVAAHQAAAAFELHEQSEHMLQLALKCDETAYWPHHALGLFLLNRERYAEAGEMFEWCFDQKPGDARVEELLLMSRRFSRQKRTSVRSASHAGSRSAAEL
jgi:O-antigen ligase/tetratricopeptide (TPR) repeat protein